MNEEKSLVDEAKEAAARLEHAFMKNEALFKQQEALEARAEARRLLGGNSHAGSQAPQVSEAEKQRQDLKEYWKGTLIEGAFK